MNRLTIVPVLLLALRPAPAGACSCALPPPVAEAFAEYDAVFIGRAVSYRPIWLSALGSGRAVTFEVEEAWKGISGQRVEVKTGSIGGSCGVWPANGERLIVFASRWEEGLHMGICSNTTSDAQAIERARAEIAATGAEPIELTAGPDPEFGPPLLPLCGAGVSGALGVAAVGLLPLGLFTQPRRRPRRATKRILQIAIGLPLACLLLATSCPPGGGFYCDGPAGLNISERDPSTGEMMELYAQGGCRPGRWSIRGDELVAVVEPMPFRPAAYTPYPSTFVTTTTVVRATRVDGRWAGDLTLLRIYLSSLGDDADLPVTDVIFAEDGFVVSASNGELAVLLTIHAPPSDDHDGLVQEANQLVQVKADSGRAGT